MSDKIIIGFLGFMPSPKFPSIPFSRTTILTKYSLDLLDYCGSRGQEGKREFMASERLTRVYGRAFKESRNVWPRKSREHKCIWQDGV